MSVTLTYVVEFVPPDLESNMMSVMRVKELTDLDSEMVDLSGSNGGVVLQRSAMPKESSRPGEALLPLLNHDAKAMINSTLAPLNSDALIQSGWPWRGSVQFCNVSMRYSPTAPLVLKDVTLSIPAGTTLGVVGRSGSGKSSLLLTLFRLVEIEGDGIGSIQIDGVDVRSISIDALRHSLAIIPQDPVLFTGTLAYNLDATGNASETDMLQALEIASPDLAASFRHANGLATVISNSLLSVGERQLICLARALLRKSKILVLDEATSSVDSKTDQKVQETIRREFVDRGVTVITVAHRLDTVLAYDRIAVFGEGKLLEYGPPKQLIAIPGGELQKLVLADRLNKRKGGKKRTITMNMTSLVSA
jgi:ABC-type multidrug transport system fused ATPase/permease subunit